MTSLSTSRSNLRADLRKRRRAFVDENQPTFLAMPQLMAVLGNASCIGGFTPLRDEPDVLPFLAELPQDDVTLALPHFGTRESSLQFKIWSPRDPLETSPFRFLQPFAKSDDVTPDALLIPLLGFDRSGNRLGQGAGHYDRYLAERPHVLKVGIAWAMQECDTIPIEPWDVPLDAICTQKEFIVVGKRPFQGS